MKSAELEQRIRENSFRISKLNEMLNKLEAENEELKKQMETALLEIPCSENTNEYTDTRITQSHKALSDELYEYIEKQIAQVVGHTNHVNEDLSCRIQQLSDDLYDHIGAQITQVIEHTDHVNENLSDRIQQLSDELYKYIDWKWEEKK